MKKLKLIPGAVLSEGIHNYSLPFPFNDSEFDEIELNMFEIFNEREQMDLLIDVIRVVKPHGKLKFSANSAIPDLIRENFDCDKQGDNIECVQKAVRVLEAARDIGPEYYNGGYYVTDGKVYATENGIGKWSYRNPTGLWEPANDIARVWADMFNPDFVVDCGCGRGAFVKAFADIGVNVKGFDFSEYAIMHPCCSPEDIFQADAKNTNLEDNIADLTLVLDLMEHIYADEINKVLSEIHRISSKFVIFNIGGITSPEQVKMLKRGEPIPEGYEMVLAAGHVTFQTKEWWRRKISAHGFKIRDDLTDTFFANVHNATEVLANWKCVIIAEKIKKIVVNGFLGWGNLGDEAILNVVCANIDDNVEVIVGTTLPYLRLSTYANKIRHDVRPWDEDCSDCSVHIVVGGLNWHLPWKQLLSAKIAGHKIVALGLGAEETTSPYFKSFFEIFDLLTVRDLKSFERFKGMGLNPVLTADPAFLLPTEKVECPSNMIVVCPRYPDVATVDFTISEMVKALKEYPEEELLFVPFAPISAIGTIVDLEICRQLKSYFPRAHIFEKPESPEQLNYVISQSKHVITNGRYHAILFALKHHKPVTYLSPFEKQAKCRGLLELSEHYNIEELIVLAKKNFELLRELIAKK